MNSENQGNYSGNFSPQVTSSPHARFPSPAFRHYSPRPNYSKNNSPYSGNGRPGRDNTFNSQWSNSPNFSPQRHFSPRSDSSLHRTPGEHRAFRRNRNQQDGSFNVHKYVDPSMLLDPWLELEQQRKSKPDASANEETA